MENLLQFQTAPIKSALLDQLESDVERFLSIDACRSVCTGDLFNSESDIETRLVNYLSKLSGHYDKIFVQYKVPKDIYEKRFASYGFNIPSPIYPWNNNIRVDIVVEKDNEFALIEIKYATDLVNGISLFGEDIEYDYLTNQAAIDLIQYNYWKDVRRIEVLSMLFPNVVGGLAIIVSNSDLYKKIPQQRSAYINFSTYHGRIVGNANDNILLDWDETHKKINKTTKEKYPEFILDGMYTCDWKPTCMQSETDRKRNFDYLILRVNKISSKFYLKNKFAVGQNTTIEDLVSWFKKDYNLVLKVYDRKRIVDNGMLLTSIGAKKGTIQFRSSISVGQLEKKFKEKLNMDVKIFTKDAWVHVLPNITLASAGQIPTSATRSKMMKFIGYKRKK